jgi:glutamine amidotransferase
LPGVGAFADAVTELKKRRLFFALKEEIARKKIFLGICLGMQLLFEGSQEAPGQKGLALLGGSVKKFQASRRLKVPQMGWNQLDIRKSACPLLRGVSEGDYVYFCHSYYPEPKDKSQAAATTRYGTDFASVIWKDNLFAVQFHPEKSQAVGLKILKNFVKL